jgi:hypothetical protein
MKMPKFKLKWIGSQTVEGTAIVEAESEDIAIELVQEEKAEFDDLRYGRIDDIEVDECKLLKE